MGELNDRADRCDRHQIIGDGEPGQHDERDRPFHGHRVMKSRQSRRVDKTRAAMLGSPDHRRVAVAFRHADHNVARPYQGQMRRHRRAREPVEDGDVVKVW
jgi:hypothetical protein